MATPCEPPKGPGLSQDAAIVLALADTAVNRGTSVEDEAERWLRVLRLHGEVGCTLQALGVGEGPLETTAQAKAVRLLRSRAIGEDAVEMVADRACHLARLRRANALSTVDVLFAVLELYDQAFDRALYVRGTTRDELLECLAKRAESREGSRTAR